jgi:hypothetical protein
VIDRRSGARLLRKAHGDSLTDLDVSNAEVPTGGWRKIASCAKDGRLVVLGVPPSFDEDSVQFVVSILAQMRQVF